jgi:hypothetical protein
MPLLLLDHPPARSVTDDRPESVTNNRTSRTTRRRTPCNETAAADTQRCKRRGRDHCRCIAAGHLTAVLVSHGRDRGSASTPDANRLAHDTIREQMRQGDTGPGWGDRKATAQAHSTRLMTTRREGPGEVEGLVLDLPRAPPGSCQRCSSHRGRASPSGSGWEPSAPGVTLIVLTGRATCVPQAADTSGIQRTTTVTSRRPVGWAHIPDLRYGRRPKLHGMHGSGPYQPCRARLDDRL